MKMNMKNKMMVTVLALGCAGVCLAGPGGRGPGGFGPMGGGRGPAPMHQPSHGHHDGAVIAGAFGAGLVGGLIGNVFRPAPPPPERHFRPVVVAPAPIVVTEPAVVVEPTVSSTRTETVWVPGAYVEQIGTHGSIVRVWQPGHYETRHVTITSETVL